MAKKKPPVEESEQDVSRYEASEQDKAKAASNNPKAVKRKFTKRQVAGRLRQLKGLFEEWLITESFYNVKVAECEAAL